MFPAENPLCAIQFSMHSRTDAISALRIRTGEVNAVLASISEHLRTAVADNLYVQKDLRVYDNGNFWVIKPSEDRLWSEAAALNDADLVVAEHLETTKP